MAAWMKNTFCADATCVEVTPVDVAAVAVRDGRDFKQRFFALPGTVLELQSNFCPKPTHGN
jgi:hypothetical protein